ncbi:WAR1 [Candida theae]|uniref:WAR1 n=1 Tax=Candida theae TaxID=1198502 RepID=A0AAD5BIJ0_9ASCO|nr:WAR1 [Candida theae]KAI5966613.1 WAR1 [Candida theae]
MSVTSNNAEGSVDYTSSSPQPGSISRDNRVGISHITHEENDSGVSSPLENRRRSQRQGSEYEDDLDQDHEYGSDSPQSQQSNKRTKVTRRSIACKSCHALKVKCTPSDPEDPSKPCIRCVNANRRCEIDLNQTRKRRKKSEILEAKRREAEEKLKEEGDDRVAAAGAPTNSEKSSHKRGKANPKTTSANSPVHASQNRNHNSTVPPISSNLNPANPRSQNSSPTKSTSDGANSQPNLSSPHLSKDEEIAALKQRILTLETQLNHRNHFHRKTHSDFQPESSLEMFSPPFVSKSDLEQEITTLAETSSKLTDLTNELNNLANKRTRMLKSDVVPDVVSKGFLTLPEAERRLQLYRSRILSFLPFIDVPADATADTLRKEQPFLFNAVMAASNVVDTTSTQSEIDHALLVDNEAIRSVCDEVMVVGKKTVELIKSMLVLTLYYNSPELFRQRRYHLLNNICVSLLHDLGIVARPSYSFDNNDGSLKKNPEQKTSDEYKSLVLIIYFSTVSICLILRRAIYIKWTPYVEECCVALENSPEMKYRKLALFARINAALEKIHHIIHSPEVSDRRISSSQYMIQELQRQLSELRKKIDDDDHVFLSYLYSVEAYLHEPNLSYIFKPEESQLSAAAVKAISNCTNSCLAALNEYNKLSSDQIAQMPLSFGSRVMYTGGMLLRLRFLILSLPSHIEKDLVPRDAVVCIQRVSNLVEQAHNQHPTNHLLKKTRLVLQLFIQTYATQVHDLIRKNGETPQNFKPNNRETVELNRVTSNFEDSRGRSSLTRDEAHSVPLDILSFAASYRREGNPSDRPRTVSESKENPGTPQTMVPQPIGSQVPFTSAGNTPVNQVTSPPPSSIPFQPLQLPVIQPSQQLQHQSFLNHVPSADTGINSSVGPVATSSTTNPFEPNATQQHTGLSPGSFDYRQFRIPSLSNASGIGNTGQSVFNNNGNNPQPHNFNPNLANPDQLENSYMVLNDEFWSNLLSTDSTDRINFSSNNAHWNQMQDEVFFEPNKHLSLSQLSTYTGENNGAILLAINGSVYDVSSNRAVYGPKGSYHNLVGKDAARVFVTGCFMKPDEYTYDLRGLDKEECQKDIRGWQEYFETHRDYWYVGKVDLTFDFLSEDPPSPCMHVKFPGHT